MNKQRNPPTRYLNERNDRFGFIDAEAGKLPPQALDLEEVILGAILIERDALGLVMDVLKAEMFYKEAHQRIYSAVVELFQSGSPIDIRTVTHHLRKSGSLEMIGDIIYLIDLTNKVNSSANIVYHTSLVVQAYMSRCLIGYSQDILRNAYEDTTDVFTLIDSAQLSLDKIQSQLIKKAVQSGTQVMQKALQETEAVMNRKEGFAGVDTGITELNELYGGWQKGDLIVLAARPGMGKTAVACGFGRSALVSGVPVGIFSMEMPEVQLAYRFQSMEAYHSHNAIIPYEEIKKGKLSKEQYKIIHKASGIYTSDKLQIDDTPALSIQTLRSRAIQMVTRHKVGLIIVDYLQLMVGDQRGNRDQEIGSITRGLKALAKELDLPIIALAQLSREVEKRADKQPQLSDLRESGSIEQDADIVIFPFRPHYYGIEQTDTGILTENLCDILTRKNRNGKCPENTLIKFLPSVSAIGDWLNYKGTVMHTVHNSFPNITSEEFPPF